MNTKTKAMLVALATVCVAAIIGCTTDGNRGHQVAGGPQRICPVMGSTIDKDLYVDYEGKRIYVCCSYCLKKVRKDPEKYMKQLEAEGVVLDKATPKAEATHTEK
jgi:YHS domain-containing protein